MPAPRNWSSSPCSRNRSPPGHREAAAREGAPRIIRAGEIWFGRGALLQAFKSLIRVSPATHLIDNGTLTARQGQILHLVGAGLSNKEVARRLMISDQTVKTHLHRIYRKLHQSGRYKAFLSQLPAPEDAAPKRERRRCAGPSLLAPQSQPAVTFIRC